MSRTILVPPAMYEGSNVSTSSSELVIVHCLGVIVILVGVRWYLIVVLIGMFQMTNVEHFFIYLLATCMYFLIYSFTFITNYLNEE